MHNKKIFCIIKMVKKMRIDQILNLMIEKVDWAKIDSILVEGEDISSSPVLTEK